MKDNYNNDRSSWDDDPLFRDVFRDEEETKRISLEPSAAPVRKRLGADDPAKEKEIELEERDFRPVRTSRTGKLGCLGGIMYAVFIVCVSIILACAAWLAACDVLALNKSEATGTIILPKEIFTEREQEVKDSEGNVTGTKTVQSADIDYVATALKDAGIIQYKTLFKLFASISHADVKLDPGTYVLSTEMDYRALVKNMQVGTGSMVVTTITFPEGMTMDQIFTKLEEEGVCSKEDLYKAAADFSYNFRFLEDVGTGDAARLEGFIFPNTYDFYQGEQGSSVINKFLTALHSRITADMWAQIENRETTFRETTIVASIIEKEAGSDEERALIASVIYNRIAAGMTLGMDSTVLYEFQDYAGGVNLPQSIRNYDSPYNTHLYTGLPPTPICNPGIASINAALQPANTNFYYYALDVEAGVHRFFTNAAEFEAFVATQNYD